MTHEKDERINVGAGMVPTYHATESVEEAKAVVESCCSATDELRRLLDERGVEWWPGDSRIFRDSITHWIVGKIHWSAIEGNDGLVLNNIELNRLTPEQAVDATLGAGTCHTDETERIWCRYKGGLHDSFLTVHVMECSACGRTYEHVNGDYEYCPHCGRRIEKEDK